MIKCRICGIENIDKKTQQENVDYIKHGNWYAHKSCYEERERRRGNIDIHEEQSDEFWKDASYYYLTKDLKIPITNVFFIQWERYMKSKKPFYSAKGIYFALRYFYNIKHGDTSKAAGGIGIIPYIYDDSKAYWYDLENKQKGIVAAIEQQMRAAMERKQITISKKETKPRKFEVDFSVLDDLEDDE